ncbi:MAG: 50S ribosomal protein L32 [Candidatus Melainabacteria bacterium]|jgi:large subunit ribosomal protein L32|nr:50S ribosomal protein L32 [Candidatus Melainabacteria bacterium]
MAQPKKKTSHQKQHQRRAHWKAEEINIAKCSNCGAPARSHQICIVCGYYGGRPARRRDNVVTE